MPIDGSGLVPLTNCARGRGRPWLRDPSDPDAGAELEPDVRVGDWAMPWNAKSDTGRLAPGILKSDFWASDPRGIEHVEQVGRVYTAHGLEFDSWKYSPYNRA